MLETATLALQAMSNRAQTTQSVYLTMSHFPITIALMDIIKNAIHPMPSDEIIYEGCELALATMLHVLLLTQPATPGRITKHESTIHGWLNSAQAREAIDPEILDHLKQAIEQIFMPHWSPCG